MYIGQYASRGLYSNSFFFSISVLFFTTESYVKIFFSRVKLFGVVNFLRIGQIEKLPRCIFFICCRLLEKFFTAYICLSFPFLKQPAKDFQRRGKRKVNAQKQFTGLEKVPKLLTKKKESFPWLSGSYCSSFYIYICALIFSCLFSIQDQSVYILDIFWCACLSCIFSLFCGR